MPRQHGRIGCTVIVAALAFSGVGTAEILYLKEGGSVEGEVQEISENGYRVRTVYGVIVVPFDSVVRREESDPAVSQYDRKLRALDDTAEAHFSLAAWCDQQGMRGEQRKHLRRVIELDPDHEGARTALGFVRVNGIWIDGRTAPSKPTTAPGGARSTQSPPAGDDDADDEKLVAAIQAQYARRIRAIRSTYLDGATPELVAEGRRRIQEFQDPLAILPLARILSEGKVVSREILVDMLARFTQDEATMNLSAMALLDADEGIRRRALSLIVRRDDPRIAAQFREALRSNNDTLVRRAAIGLGVLRVAGAVPDLIDALTVQRRKRIDVPVQGYFGGWGEVFNNPTSLQVGKSLNVRHRPVLGVATAGPYVLPATEMRTANVTVLRTEVLEALVAITGENHGFDAAQWRRWYEERKP